MEDPFSVAYDQMLLGHYRGMSDEDLDAEVARLERQISRNKGRETQSSAMFRDSAQYDRVLAETVRRERAAALLPF